MDKVPGLEFSIRTSAEIQSSSSVKKITAGKFTPRIVLKPGWLVIMSKYKNREGLEIPIPGRVRPIR